MEEEIKRQFLQDIEIIVSDYEDKYNREDLIDIIREYFIY
jgi:hypothetical protein